MMDFDWFFVVVVIVVWLVWNGLWGSGGGLFLVSGFFLGFFVLFCF